MRKLESDGFVEGLFFQFCKVLKEVRNSFNAFVIVNNTVVLIGRVQGIAV